MLILFVVSSTNSFSRVLEKYRKIILKNGVKVKVIKVNRPDTITCKMKDEEYKVHLLGINPPAKDTIYYDKAKKMLEKLILNKNVHLYYDDVKELDDGTLLAYVYYRNVFYLANATLLKRGLATINDKYPMWLKKEFKRLVKWAKRHKKGIWKDKEYIAKYLEDEQRKDVEEMELFKEGTLSDSDFKYNPKKLAEITIKLKNAQNNQIAISKILENYSMTPEEYYSAVESMANNPNYLEYLKKMSK